MWIWHETNNKSLAKDPTPYAIEFGKDKYLILFSYLKSLQHDLGESVKIKGIFHIRICKSLSKLKIYKINSRLMIQNICPKQHGNGLSRTKSTICYFCVSPTHVSYRTPVGCTCYQQQWFNKSGSRHLCSKTICSFPCCRNKGNINVCFISNLSVTFCHSNIG